MTRRPPPPDLIFGPDGAPEAVAFGDIYFSRDGGLAESEAVFLAGCGLPDAWAGRRHFQICELGFGSGLNVLAAWRLWRAHRPVGAILHIVSIEGYPMPVEAAERAHAAFPEVADLAAKLRAQWPVAAYAPQRLWFEEDGVAITIVIADVADGLDRLTAEVDAWFLDGFAPSRNPAMWTEAVLARVGALSAPGATLATYSTAGAVRRGLAQAGFTVEKRPGFAAKRERLEARFEGERRPLSRPPARIAILGAGIAGAAVVAALKRRGLTPMVFDAAPSLGAGASGNPAALVMPRLDRGDTPEARLFLTGYLAALQTYRVLGAPAFAPIGVIERAKPGREAALADLLADPPLPDALLRPYDGAAFHPQAGVVRPHRAIPALLRGTPVAFGVHVTRIAPHGDGWRLFDAAGKVIADADALIVANGPDLAALVPLAPDAVRASRGQLEWGPANPPSSGPALAGGPYAAPLDGGVLFGATFSRPPEPADAPADEDSRRENIASLQALAPAWADALDEAQLQSRASVRAVTPDYLQIAGPVAPGLYALGGLGARGFLMAPLLAEAIVSHMMGEPLPLDSQAWAAVDPTRFARRALRKGGG